VLSQLKIVVFFCQTWNVRQ